MNAALPPGWVQEEGPDDTWVLAHPPVPEGHFRPNLVIRIGRNDGHPLEWVATTGLAATMAQFAALHVLSVDEWPKVFDPSLGRAVPGRRQRFVYQGEGQTVCVDRWIWVLGAGLVEATGSYALEDHTGQKTLIEYLVDQLTITGHGSNRIPDWAELDRAELDRDRDPRPDVFASQQRETYLEDLSRVAAEQPYRPEGRLLTEAAADLLLSLCGRKKLGRFDLAGNRSAAAELVEAGLLTAEGHVTEKGAACLYPLTDPVARLSLTARRGNEETAADVWIGEGLALLVAGPSFFGPSSEPAYGPGEREVRILPPALLPLVLASWAGVAPAWAMRHDPLVVSEGVFHARVASSSVPAPNAGEAEHRLWAAQWTSWDITHIEANAGFRWLHAGEAGHYSVIPADGGIRLDAQPSSLVWDAIARTVHTAATGAPLDLGADVPSAWLHARSHEDIVHRPGNGAPTR
ncbi:hypothetical protein [Arthrobacter sp. zg-Y750]|uniref:hypothetical protein n=1 Tax=Arthrobacter sp. zg-Y750 TaxID=2894189 RepID=UPI001E3B1199|nr:hypothetical protein [Arthrobacter sp. zg-Y750]MCC9176277.1 hypothetical protein [Arthrobacter sp. zg-Y750]